MKQKFDINGMTCSVCQNHITSSVKKCVGVNSVDVNLLTNSMVVEYDDTLVTTTTIKEAVSKAGYQANLAGDSNRQENGLSKKRKELIISFIFLGLLMYISMSSMFAYPIPTVIKETPIVNLSLQIGFLLPILYLHRMYFINGFKTLFHLQPTMDSLIAIGAGASIIYSLYSLIIILIDSAQALHMMHTIYFESAGMIVTLISFGKYLESKSKQKTTDAISKLMDLAPDVAIRIKDGQEESVAVDSLQIGDIVLVKANETIPIDGVIVKGSSNVNEAMITGESLPVEKTMDSKVIGGTHNLQGTFQCQVTTTTSNSTLAKIIALVEEASSSKAPLTSIVDKVVTWFVPAVIVIACVTLVTWLLLGESFSFAMSNAVAVLVISCPCALGLATPVAIMVSTGVGAKNGILLKSASVLENERNIDVVVLDKTGTITKGKASVSDIYSNALKTDELLSIAASLEKGSTHVLANAIVEKAKEKNVVYLEVENFCSIDGMGLQGTINQVLYTVGNHSLMEKQKISIQEYQDEYISLMDAGKTCVFVASNAKLVGILGIYDDIKETSIEAIEMLKKAGVRVIMLTGDTKRAANAINKTLQLDDVIAEVLPQDKEQVIQDLQKQGHHVLMVGDGINDAPALVRSDVGVAIGAGNDIAIDSADVILMKDDLRDIMTSISLSIKTVRTIKENLFWAFIYNIIGIPIAAGVFYNSFGIRLDAMIAALCMSLSSLCVISNALRLKKFKAKHEEKKKMKREIKIEGMMCDHCKKRVTDALMQIKDTTVTVDLTRKLAIVETSVSDAVLTSAIETAGYQVVEINNV